ncbi:MAG TPA: glycosyltransferase family 4 protein [Vicinamibacterales bacterium]|nr:glycosyltransferase family 4 protein [Vicinamibacterales bacterium]
MRILVAHEASDSAGGVETYLSCVVVALRARGHEIAALYHRGGSAREGWSALAGWRAGIQELGHRTAFDLVRAWRPDVCFSHNMGPLAVDRALLREWPVVKMMHGYFGTCASGLKTHGLPSMRACGRRCGPACLALYVPRRCGSLTPRAMLRGYRWARQQRAMFGAYAKLGVASAHMQREYERHGVPREHIRVLPLFSTLGPAGADEAAPPGTAAVLFAGRMTKLKGGQVLVAAAARAGHRLGRAIPLIMAGDGPARVEWQQLAVSLGVHVEFTGWLAPEARADVFRRAAILAVPSIWPEPFGLVGLEAASLGIPAAAFDTGGVREWLEPDRSGLLVDPRQGSEGLALAIARLTADEMLRQRLSAGARAVAARMPLAAHVDRLESMLEEARRV